MRTGFVAAFTVLLAGCSGTGPPEITSEMIRSSGPGATGFVQLQQGRTLFASRCIECHALPRVTAHTATEWPRLLDQMADRASLNTAERQAILAYLLAARAQH